MIRGLAAAAAVNAGIVIIVRSTSTATPLTKPMVSDAPPCAASAVGHQTQTNGPSARRELIPTDPHSAIVCNSLRQSFTPLGLSSTKIATAATESSLGIREILVAALTEGRRRRRWMFGIRRELPSPIWWPRVRVREGTFTPEPLRLAGATVAGVFAVLVCNPPTTAVTSGWRGV